ncbi:hypothetical protein BTR23_16190 [Alkalihalophilus pseudofirmus]|nr:hypothetical protein BTR23_16190 [Alkalihalophilus pseudofirmus]
MKVIKIGNKEICSNKPCFIIGEIGTNHNKNKEIAKQLIDVAADAGVDAVKFQTFRPTDIVHSEIPANIYGHYQGENHTYWAEILNDLVLPEEWYSELWDYAHKKGLIVLSTAVSSYCTEFLMTLNTPAFKVASMDLNYFPLLEKLAKTNKPIILSTGMGYLSEIDEAIRFIKENGNDQIIITHCVSNYPAKPEQLNLKQIPLLEMSFNVPVGFSDHSLGVNSSIAAVALGAKVIEKHITLNRKMNGPDHSFSLEPNEVKMLVNGIREVELAIGSNRVISLAETEKRETFRRSIVTKVEISKNETITKEKLQITRPGYGIPSKFINEVIGMKVTQNLPKNTVLEWKHFKILKDKDSDKNGN